MMVNTADSPLMKIFESFGSSSVVRQTSGQPVVSERMPVEPTEVAPEAKRGESQKPASEPESQPEPNSKDADQKPQPELVETAQAAKPEPAPANPEPEATAPVSPADQKPEPAQNENE
jgi:hypothetical protein